MTTEMLMLLAGGLILFLNSVRRLSEIVHLALGQRVKYWLLRSTSNTLKSIVTGMLVTVILDSSSAVIIITLIVVNSGLLSLRQSMGIVLGANIGTTFGSQIVAVGASTFSPVLLLIGFVLMVATRNNKWRVTGEVVLNFGMLFFGLLTMETAIAPLKDSPHITGWLQLAENPVRGALLGGIVTLIVQSSSATVAMAIILTKKGLLTLAGGVAVMLGAELGTCSDTLLASVGLGRRAMKTGLFHLWFNLISIAVALACFYPFVNFVDWLSGDMAIEQTLANSQMMFNLIGVALFAWAIPLCESGLNSLLPKDICRADCEQLERPRQGKLRMTGLPLPTPQPRFEDQQIPKTVTVVRCARKMLIDNFLQRFRSKELMTA